MNQNPTNETAAGELQRRDHVILTNRPHVYRVEQTHRYTDRDRDGDAVEKVLLIVTRIGDTVPQGERLWASEPVRVATDEQVAEARTVAISAEIATDLRKLADLVETHKPRFKSWSGLTVSGTMIDGEISRVAAALGMELRDGYGASKSKRLAWSPTESDLGEGLTVSFEGVPAPAPAVAEHLLLAAGHEASGPVAQCVCGDRFDGETLDEARAQLDRHVAEANGESMAVPPAAAVDAMADRAVEVSAEPAEAEHRVSSAWKGGPGECGAQCACGLTYDGFDTLKEPSDLIDRHVATEAGAPATGDLQSGR
ncbi:hypothetical protein OOJ91_13985 [Micromonospora lupini]|uniref:hypothetical protein n=1 Tax=Micromonospora lupini TaxID=285679 RepID=UPI00225540D8|nr:hypothetical protein [Micromonospora lupini]MCX5066958.1 hypothetical protein [Micromonospora lupini]